MKTRSLLALLLLPWFAQAQEKSPSGKRVVDPDGGVAQPLAINVGAISSTNLDPELKQVFESFFAKIKDGRISDAWKKMLEGSRIGEDPEILAEFISKSEKITELHGKVIDWELLRVKSTGKHLREIIYQLSCKDHPTRWRIFAYQAEGKWQILNVEVVSDLTKMFE